MDSGLSTEVRSSVIERLCRPWWTCWCSLHWGFRRHACVYWCCHGEVPAGDANSILGAAVTYPVSVIIVYRELVENLLPERDLAKKIVAMTPEKERSHLSRFVAGNNVFDQGKGSIRPIHKLIDEITVPSGFPRLRLTDDSIASRVPTSRMIDDAMRLAIEIRSGRPFLKPSEVPILLISSECPKLVSAIPTLEFDAKNPEAVLNTDTTKDDIFSALCNAYRDYPSVVSGKPIEVLRQEAINRSDDPTQRFINHMEFDSRMEDQRRPRKF